jgi:hypothetical protein
MVPALYGTELCMKREQLSQQRIAGENKDIYGTPWGAAQEGATPAHGDLSNLKQSWREAGRLIFASPLCDAPKRHVAWAAAKVRQKFQPGSWLISWKA